MESTKPHHDSFMSTHEMFSTADRTAFIFLNDNESIPGPFLVDGSFKGNGGLLRGSYHGKLFQEQQGTGGTVQDLD